MAKRIGPEKYAEMLRGAISWLEPPFVDANTSDAEARIRIKFMLADVARADRLRKPPQEER